MGFVQIAFAGFLSLPLLSTQVTVAAGGEPLRADVVVNDGAATFSPSSNWLRSEEGVKSLTGNPVPQHLATVRGVDFSPADRWSMLWNAEGIQVWSAFRTDATQPMLTLPAGCHVKFAAGDSTLVSLEPAGPDDTQRIHTVRVWTLDVAEEQWTESASFACSAQRVRSYEDPNVWGSIADMARRRVVAEVTDRWLIFSTNENELQLCDLVRRPPPFKAITLAGDVQSWTLIRGWLIASTLSGMRFWHLGADDPAATERGFSGSPCSLQESEIGDDGSRILYRRGDHFEHYSTKTSRLTRLNVGTPLRIGRAANNVKRYVECSHDHKWLLLTQSSSGMAIFSELVQQAYLWNLESDPATLAMDIDIPQTRIGKSLVYWKFHLNTAGTLMWAVPSQGAPRLWTPQNGCRFENPDVTVQSAGQCTTNIDGTGVVSRSPDLQHLEVWDIDATQPTAPRLSLPTSGSAKPVFLSDDRRWLVCCDGASAFIWDLHAPHSQDFAYKCDVTLAVDSRVKVTLFHDRWLVLTTGEYFLPGKIAVAWDLQKGAGAPPIVKLDTAIVRDNILVGTNSQVGLRLWRFQDEEMCQSAPMDLPDPQGACWVSAGCKMIAMRDNQGRSHVWDVERLLQANR